MFEIRTTSSPAGRGSGLHVPPRSAQGLAAAMRAAGDRDITARIIPTAPPPQASAPAASAASAASGSIGSIGSIGSMRAWSWLPSRRLSNALLEILTSWLPAELEPRTK